MTVRDRPSRTSDDALALLLAVGTPINDAAEQVKLSPRTVRRRLEDHTFRNRVTELRGRVMLEATGRLVETLNDASRVLHTLAISAESEPTRARAAIGLWDLALRARSAEEVEQRLARVEELLEIRGVRHATSREDPQD